MRERVTRKFSMPRTGKFPYGDITRKWISVLRSWLQRTGNNCQFSDREKKIKWPVQKWVDAMSFFRERERERLGGMIILLYLINFTVGSIYIYIYIYA